MISQRLRGLNEEGEALEKSFIPKLGKAFGDVGIQIMDQNGELRSTFDILDDLAAKWDSLSSAQRQYLGEKAAGNRQVKTLNAIMQNWDVVTDTIQKAEEASGAALEGNAKYMDSIEGRIVQFQSAFQDLARTTISSDLVKSITSLGTGIVKLITDIGGLQKVLVPVMAIIAISKWNNFAKAITAIGKSFLTASKHVSVFRVGLAAITTAIAVYNAIVAKQQQARQEVIDTGRASAENAINLAEAVAKYESLAAVTDKTKEQEEEFQDAVETVNSALGEKASILKGLTAGTEEYTKALRDATAEEIKQAKIDAQKAVNAAKEKIMATNGLGWDILEEYNITSDFTGMPADQWRELFEYDKVFGDIYHRLFESFDQITGLGGNVGFQADSFEEIISLYYVLSDAQDQLTQRQIETGNTFYAINKIYGQAGEYINQYKEAVEGYMDSLYYSTTLDLGVPDTAEEYDAVAEAMKRAAGASGEFANAISSYVNIKAQNAGISTTISGEDFSDVKEDAQEAATALRQLIEEYGKTIEAQKALTDAIAEQSKSGIISVTTAQELLESGSQYNEMLTLTAEGYALNTEAVYAYIEAQNAEQKLKALEEIKERQKALKDLQKERESLADTERNAEAIQENESRQSAIQAEIDGYAALIREIDSATGALARYNAAKSTKNQDEDFNTGQQAYKDITEGLKTGKVGTDDFKTAVGFILGEDWQEELDKFGGSVEKAYAQAQKTGKRYFGQEDERTGMANFRDDLVKAGYAQYDAKTGQFDMLDRNAFNGNIVTIENMAAALGMSEDAVRSLFELMESYGAEFEFPEYVTKDDIKNTKELAEAAKQATESSESLTSSSAQELEIYKSQIEQQIASYQKVLEGADPESDQYKYAAEQVGILQEALTNVETVLADMGSESDTLTFDQTVQQINDLQQAVTGLANAHIDIPVTLTEQADVLTSLLESLGSTDGESIVISVDNAEDAQQKMQGIQEKMDAVRENSDIPISIKTEILSAGDMALTELQNFINNGTNEETHIVISAIDEATPQIKSLTEAQYEDIQLKVDAIGDAAEEEIQRIVGGDYTAYVAIKAQSVEEPASFGEDRHGGGGGAGFGKNHTGAGRQPEGLPSENLVESVPSVPVKAEVMEVDTEKVEETPIEMPVTPVVDENSVNTDDLDGGSVEVEVDAKNPEQVVKDTQNAADSEPVEIPVDAESPEKISDQVREAVNEAPPTEAEIRFAQDSIDRATQQVQDSASKQPIEMDAETVMQTVVDAGDGARELISIANEAGAAQEEVAKLQEAYRGLYDAADALDTAEPNTDSWNTAADNLVSAAGSFSSAYSDLESALGSLKPVVVNANTAPAIQAIDALSRRTITIRANVTNLPYARGTKNAVGGTSLVDEKGAELIEHTKQGTFELGTNKGPRFTNLDKGDVVHTASETKKILSRMAKVGGFFRDGLNRAKSVIGGAFATGVSGGMSWNLINKTLKAVQNSNKKTTTTTTKSKSKGVSAKSLQNYTDKLFDWAEIRLERLKTITNTWLLNAAEAVGYIARNNELTSAIKSVEDEIENTTKAYELYVNQANIIAQKAGLTQDIIDKIHSGDIEIAEYSKDIQEKIKSYQEWYDRAQECVEALTDLREQEKELAKQRLDNVINHYNYRIDQLDNIVSQRESDLDLMTKQGVEINASEYGMSIDATLKKLEQLIEQREVLQNEFEDAVRNGFIQKESEEWYEYDGKLAEITRTITETKGALIELHDAANAVSLTNLGWQLDALTNSADSMNDFMSLHSAQEIEETVDAYKDLIQNGMEQIRNLEEQNRVYREQQSGLDVLSEKYQELQSNIESNNRAIMDMKVSQEEWNDTILDLQIQRLEKFKDSLSKTNDQYQRQKELQEALQELEKARSQRTQRVYHQDVGFVYEMDQEAVRQAQTNLEDVIENQLMDRLDDLIDAINEQKKNTNVYDANGVLLGTEYATPQLDNLANVLSDYYSGINAVSPLASLKDSLYDQLVSNINNSSTSNSASINIGEINVNEVNDANALAEAIVDQFPNAILQELYKG